MVAGTFPEVVAGSPGPSRPLVSGGGSMGGVGSLLSGMNLGGHWREWDDAAALFAGVPPGVIGQSPPARQWAPGMARVAVFGHGRSFQTRGDAGRDAGHPRFAAGRRRRVGPPRRR